MFIIVGFKTPASNMLNHDFFDQDAQQLAQALLGKVLCVKHNDIWLQAMIIETEAYYLTEKGSHSSLGFTPKRKALFMAPGTIYMYYARGGKDSLNISAKGEGNAVLLKSGIPYEYPGNEIMLEAMQKLNPSPARPISKLCSGQTLLCKSLGLKLVDWDQKNFDPERFFIKDVHYRPQKIIQTTRLGIAPHRDAHLPYRFIDYQYAFACTKNPLNKPESYTILNREE
jgi:DNA-3-methyladenine glycosylase